MLPVLIWMFSNPLYTLHDFNKCLDAILQIDVLIAYKTYGPNCKILIYFIENKNPSYDM